MKISNSKKQLARIITENGGWISGNYAIQDKDDKCIWFMFKLVGRPRGRAYWPGAKSNGISCDKVLPNWHKTILSREEYFFLHQEQGLEDAINEDLPDADGWIEWKGGVIGPVKFGELVDVKLANGELLERVPGDGCVEWKHCWGDTNIIAYRLHKPERARSECCELVMRSIPEPEIHSKNTTLTQVDDIDVVESRPTIEQLAADYRDTRDYAERKQEEADTAKADADGALRKLELAGEGVGLIVTPITAKQEPELVITDWRDLRVGDAIWWCGDEDNAPGEYEVKQLESDDYDGFLTIAAGNYWVHYEEDDWKFIRRP